MKSKLKLLGPGLLFAGAAIGVSHLVQSTKAGAEYGMGLLWALLLANIFKYPSFLFGPKYASVTGYSLITGYARLGRGVLYAFLVLTFLSMFTIQSAVTVVCAGILCALTNGIWNTEVWAVIVLVVTSLVLWLGSYKTLDKAMKYVIVLLAISTLVAVSLAVGNFSGELNWQPEFPTELVGVSFLIAFMGWMPAPLDISVWHSVWAVEKKEAQPDYDAPKALFDFKVGYGFTIVLGVAFVMLGALVLYGSGETIAPSALLFAKQLMAMYTNQLGSWSFGLIGLAAFTTMFSTTLTTLDASPRVMSKGIELSNVKGVWRSYKFWLLILTVGTMIVFLFAQKEMGWLIKVATILSFVTAPFYAVLNLILINGKEVSKEDRPSLWMNIWGVAGVLFLLGFSIWFLVVV